MTKHPGEPNDPDRDRLDGQVQVIIDALGEDVVDWDTEDRRNCSYLFAKDWVLVRPEDVDLLQSRLRENQDLFHGEGRAEGRESGVVRFHLPQDRDASVRKVPASLSTLGVPAEVATPDHILYVTPTGSLCPATEPVPTKAKGPVPPVASDSGLGRGISVVVVDTGLYRPTGRRPNWQLPDWMEQDVDGDPEILDVNDIRAYGGHGTFIAGIVKCVAPGASVYVEGLRVLPDDTVAPGGATFESELVEQLHQALDREPDIIALSAGTRSRADQELLGFKLLWENRLKDSKTLLVAAAGNDGVYTPFWPAAFDWAVGVGATNEWGATADYSNRGDWVDVYARGSKIINAFPNGTYTCKEPPNQGQPRKFANGLAEWSGTSFSTPIVAGMIAARMSQTGEDAWQAAHALAKAAPSMNVLAVPYA